MKNGTKDWCTDNKKGNQQWERATIVHSLLYKVHDLKSYRRCTSLLRGLGLSRTSDMCFQNVRASHDVYKKQWRSVIWKEFRIIKPKGNRGNWTNEDFYSSARFFYPTSRIHNRPQTRGWTGSGSFLDLKSQTHGHQHRAFTTEPILTQWQKAIKATSIYTENKTKQRAEKTGSMKVKWDPQSWMMKLISGSCAGIYLWF